MVSVNTVERLNTVLDLARCELDNSLSCDHAIGVVSVFIREYRNSLLHTNEDNLNIYRDPKSCMEACSWAFGFIGHCLTD